MTTMLGETVIDNSAVEVRIVATSPALPAAQAADDQPAFLWQSTVFIHNADTDHAPDKIADGIVLATACLTLATDAMHARGDDLRPENPGYELEWNVNAGCGLPQCWCSPGLLTRTKLMATVAGRPPVQVDVHITVKDSPR